LVLKAGGYFFGKIGRDGLSAYKGMQEG